MRTDDPRDPGLAGPLAALRTELATLDAPRGVEKELMAAFARQHARPRWYHALAPRQWRMAGGLASLAVVVVVFMLALHSPARLGDRLVSVDDGAYFIALDSLERIEDEPNPRVIEADLPRTELAAFGVPVTPENAGESVRAEMVVGADGRPLAVRLTSTE